MYTEREQHEGEGLKNQTPLNRESVGEHHLKKRWGAEGVPEDPNIDSLAQEIEDSEMQREEAFASAAVYARLRTHQKNILQKKLAKNSNLLVSRTLIRFSLGIAVVLSFWQFVFASISSAAYGLQMGIITFQEETLFGKLTSFFFDAKNDLPFQTIGSTAFAVCACIAIIFFIGYLFLFHLANIPVFGSLLNFMVTATCFALSMIPFVNIFPWLLLWVIYMLFFGKKSI